MSGSTRRTPWGSIMRAQQSGLVLVILALGAVLTFFAGSFTNQAGHQVNTFLNANTLLQTSSDASLFAIMAVGATIVIISGGIDLSVGSIYALCGVMTALALQAMGPGAPLWVGLALCLGIGTVCGLFNGLLVSVLQVHPFIITLGTMWIFRGIAFVASNAVSVPLPESVVDVIKTTLGLDRGLYPVPTIVMVVVTFLGWIFLSKIVAGRHVYAMGGNAQAARYSGINPGAIQLKVFAISGLCAGIAAFVGSGYYGAASCNDANGYELFVIASAVVGGASLSGGKGAALGAMLGAILIVLIRQSIRTLRLDQNYEWIIIGSAVILAVFLDQTSRRLAQRRAGA